MSEKPEPLREFNYKKIVCTDGLSSEEINFQLKDTIPVKELVELIRNYEKEVQEKKDKRNERERAKRAAKAEERELEKTHKRWRKTHEEGLNKLEYVLEWIDFLNDGDAVSHWDDEYYEFIQKEYPDYIEKIRKVEESVKTIFPNLEVGKCLDVLYT